MKAIDFKHAEMSSITSRVDGSELDRRRERQRLATKRWRDKYPERSRESVRRWEAKNPSKKREYDRIGYLRHREKRLAKSKLRRSDPDIRLKYLLKKYYDLPLEEYKNLVEEQRGLCAICGNKQKGRLHVDHCHNTKKVRGLLCQACNHGLGHFRDNASYLVSAIFYLTKHEGN